LTVLTTACSDHASNDIDPTVDRVTDHVQLRPLSVSEDLRIVDDLDRDVLLRGVNLNALGEYWQGDPEHAPTIPVTDRDWDAMGERGISVVRLVINWSRVEPERGFIDHAYLDEIDAAVGAAAARGIYTVIDMHQDAYSAFIATEDETECEPGTRPGKGWDGAPRWATITDGLSTCVTGERNSAPAVIAAWNHFYDNTDGIADRFVAAWAALAERFAGRPEVAGYDLINEPEVSRPASVITPLYENLLAKTITAIRTAEAHAANPHLLFIEPAIPAAEPTFGIVVPSPARSGIELTNIVAAPHNYAESIDTGLDLSIEEMNDLFLTIASSLGVPVWVGEYGFWDTRPETIEKAQRFAADQDARVLGGARWQWRQGCGDPHHLTWGEPPTGISAHLNTTECPGDVDGGPTEEFLSILERAYPRATPGRIQLLVSDSVTGEFTLTASAAPSGEELLVWTPSDAETLSVTSEGLANLEEHRVPGGRIIKAIVAAPNYEIRISTIED
jgi:endoglycosylceramidase